MSPKIIHAIAPYVGPSLLFQRQELFLQSIDRADKENVLLLALNLFEWEREKWITEKATRSSLSLGDSRPLAFLLDILNLANAHAQPNDWLLYTNSDCAIAPDFYKQLQKEGGTVVEYMRKDVEGNPSTLEELFSNESKLYSIGLDGIALRAQFFREVKDYIPDFIVGEPHWDTIYSELFRKIIPVRRDTSRLFHPKHDQVWDLAEPSVSGQHNLQLYVGALQSGYGDNTCITKSSNQTDTAVIVVSFGNDPVRVAANSEGIRKQLEQDLYHDYFLVELVGEGLKSAYSSDILDRVKYIPVEGYCSSMDLFQKEALMNIGWRAALARHSYEFFIFPDADIYSESADWFRRIREKLWENPARAVHGYRIASDTKDPHIKYNSLASIYKYDFQTDLFLNPGLCWGLHRSVLEMGNGFNSLCIDCAGDSTFVAEYLNSREISYDPWLYQFRWFSEIERKLPFQAILDGVDIDIIHIHHGDLKERNYNPIRYAIDGFPPILELVNVESNGILTWKDSQCIERRILAHRLEMKTPADVDKIFRKYSYVRFNSPQDYSKECLKKRQIFQPKIKNRISPFVHSSSIGYENNHKNRVTLFNPAKVFRDEFPFSWSDSACSKPGSHCIPLKVDPPSLILEPSGGFNYVAGVITIHPNWTKCNLSPYKHLYLSVLQMGDKAQDVIVSFYSRSEENQDYESKEISLGKLGLKKSELTPFKIPLQEFENGSGFDFQSCRLLKIMGTGMCRVEFRGIYVE